MRRIKSLIHDYLNRGSLTDQKIENIDSYIDFYLESHCLNMPFEGLSISAHAYKALCYLRETERVSTLQEIINLGLTEKEILQKKYMGKKVLVELKKMGLTFPGSV